MDHVRVNLGAHLVAAAGQRGDDPAIVAEDGRTVWTFAGLVEAAGRLAAGLAATGIGEGDRVVVLERDRRLLYEIVAGVIFAGATVVIPPLTVPPRQALRLVGSVEPRAVVASTALWLPALLEPNLRRAPIRLTTGAKLPGTVGLDALRRSRPMAPRLVPSTTPAILSFTSGTTGAARPIERTHGVLQRQHEALSALRGLGRQDRDLVGVPLVVLQNLAAGVTSVPAPRGTGATGYGMRVRLAVVRTGATSAAGFPHLFEAATDGAQAAELSGLRSLHLGGTRVRPALLEALAIVAPRATATIVYGSTECEPIAAIGAEDYLHHDARSRPDAGVCVGSVWPGIELEVARPGADAGTSAWPPGVGHVRVAGARVAQGQSRDGWVDTGDIGWRDEAGLVWLLGRASNVVGDRFPVAVERAAEAVPWVERAAMVRAAERPRPRALLAVQPRSGDGRHADPEDLGPVVSSGDWPVDVAVVRRLPVAPGPGAKVDEARLRRIAGHRTG